MIDVDAVKKLIAECEFEFNDIMFNSLDYDNPRNVYLLIREMESHNLYHYIDEVKRILDKHNALEVKVSKEDIISVHEQLRDRIQNPRGVFDKQGRFYIIDSDLIDVRNPSVKYPYSQMNAARTIKFVKALAEKYRCQTIEELERVAFA